MDDDKQQWLDEVRKTLDEADIQPQASSDDLLHALEEIRDSIGGVYELLEKLVLEQRDRHQSLMKRLDDINAAQYDR